MRRPGFSLVELLVVISIIALALGLFLGVAGKAMGKARAVRCASQMATIGQAFEIYAATYNGWIQHDQYLGASMISVKTSWPEALPGLGKRSKVILCPNWPENPWNQPDTSYQSNALYVPYFRRGSRVSRTGSISTSQVVLLGEKALSPWGYYFTTVLPLSEPENEYLTWDPFRHGASSRSNILWMDMHVSNETPKRWDPEEHSWKVPGYVTPLVP